MSGKPYALLVLLLLTGCMPVHAPMVAVAGSFFPAWMLCAFAGLLLTLVARVILIRAGLDEHMPWRVVAYAALTLALTYALLLLGFSR